MSFFPISVWWVWSVSIRAGSHLSLSANVCYENPADVFPDWTLVSPCRYLSSEFNRCLARSVSQCLLPICLKGSLDVFLDQPNVFLPSVCLMCLISVYPSWFSPVSFCQCLLWEPCWCLSGLNSPVFLPMSLLVNSIDVCLKCLLTSSAKSVCLSANVFSEGTCWCLLGLNSRVSLPVSF